MNHESLATASRKLWYDVTSWICCAVFVGTIGMGSGQESRAEVRKEILTYKTVGELQIQADVFHHDDAVARSVVVWLHGGALINGNPYMAVKNVTPDYPPTLMIHGELDTDVPHEQSVMMAAEFKRHNVEHRLISIPRGEHGLAGADKKLVDEAHSAAAEFIRQHLGKP